MAFKVLQDWAQAEELAQETFVHLWKKLVKDGPIAGSAKALLITTAHSRAVDRVRSETAHNRRHDIVGRQREVVYDSTIDEVLLRFEHSQIRAALAQLGERQRRTVELAFFRNVTYRQAAQLLGMPEGTVKSQIYFCRFQQWFGLHRRKAQRLIKI